MKSKKIIALLLTAVMLLSMRTEDGHRHHHCRCRRWHDFRGNRRGRPRRSVWQEGR